MKRQSEPTTEKKKIGNSLSRYRFLCQNDIKNDAVKRLFTTRINRCAQQKQKIKYLLTNYDKKNSSTYFFIVLFVPKKGPKGNTKVKNRNETEELNLIGRTAIIITQQNVSVQIININSLQCV